MRIVFILGMHRSGSSCLTGCLEACGMRIGSVRREPGVGGNPSGTLESEIVASINERIIGSWSQPELSKDISQVLKKKIIKHIKSLDKYCNLNSLNDFGIKDPRFVLTLEHWLPKVDDWAAVGTYRNPNAVNLSLLQRKIGKINPDINFKAWKTYNNRLLSLCDNYKIPLISFDRDENSYLMHLKQICEYLGLTYNEAKVREFYNINYKRQLEFGFPDRESEDIYTNLQNYEALANTL